MRVVAREGRYPGAEKIGAVVGVRPGATALHIQHCTVPGPANPTRGTGQPFDLGVAIEHDEAGRVAADVSSAELAFHTNHQPVVDLPVPADLTAAQEPIDVVR